MDRSAPSVGLKMKLGRTRLRLALITFGEMRTSNFRRDSTRLIIWAYPTFATRFLDGYIYRILLCVHCLYTKKVRSCFTLISITEYILQIPDLSNSKNHYLTTAIQGWTLALAHSPRRVSKLSGEYESRITRPIWRVRFSAPGYIIQNKRNFLLSTL